MQTKKTLTKVLAILSFSGLLTLNGAGLQAAPEDNPQRFEKLPYTFDFDGPYYPKPSLVFEGAFPEVPEEMMVYRVKHPNVTEASVREFAQKFGIPADAELTRSCRLRLYWLKTPGQHLEVDPSNGTFIVTRIGKKDSQTDKGKDYPSRVECGEIARAYLNTYNLLSEEAYLEEIVDNTKGAGVMSVGFGRKIGGYKTWGAGAQITVEIEAGGEVAEVGKAWQELIPYKPYPIKPPEEVLEEIRNGKGVLMHGNKGKVEKITLRYYCSPQKQEYVQPIYYFECTGSNGDFYGVVPAIRQEYLKPKGKSE
ncbi:hypothetical protein ES703_92733 [subsurface metagenome]